MYYHAVSVFRWDVQRKETLIENRELGEDQIELQIKSGHDLDIVLAAAQSNLISVNYNLGFSSSSSSSEIPGKEIGCGSTAKVKYSNGTAIFNFKAAITGLKRGRTVQQTYTRRKATFELIAHKGMIFSTTSVIGICVVRKRILHYFILICS